MSDDKLIKVYWDTVKDLLDSRQAEDVAARKTLLAHIARLEARDAILRQMANAVTCRCGAYKPLQVRP